MSKGGTMDLAFGVGGKIHKNEVLSAVDQYEKYHSYHGGKDEERKANYTDMVNKYYDLATSFYEYGWGESFHFAPRWKNESLRESIKRHEHFLALQLGIKPGHKVLDVGCGIGGPLREIARFRYVELHASDNSTFDGSDWIWILLLIPFDLKSDHKEKETLQELWSPLTTKTATIAVGLLISLIRLNISASVTGLNNNEYQITRGKELNRIVGVDKTCNFVKTDFMNTTFPESSFDAIYAIEATCHAPDAVGCYKEIYRILKPGQCFAAYEWCMTDAYDPDNQEHQKIKAEIEIGNGLPDVRTTTQCFDALKKAGFEVLWDKDLAADSPLPWYLPLDPSHFSLTSFRLTSVGRFCTRNLVKVLEAVGIAPKGSQRVQAFLEHAAEGLVDGGKREIFTPMYFFLARKPLNEN